MKFLARFTLVLLATSGAAPAQSAFDLVQKAPVGAQPHAIAVGDFNGDGKPDLAVANDSDATVSILLGVGGGRFGAQATYATADMPVSIAVADFDHDGHLDLAVACYGGASPGQTVSVLHGRGDGSFGPKTDVTAYLSPVAVVAADVDGDGWPDLVVANNLLYPVVSSSVSVLLNDGHGGFASAMTTTTDYARPSALALGDLDGDGHLDLVVANAASGSVSVQLGHGDGSFAAPSFYDADAEPSAVLLADLDRDGRLDLVVANAGGNDMIVRLGQGDGTFGAATGYAAGTYPASLAAADLDGDGFVDLVVGNGRDGASLYRGHGDGTFDAAVPVAVAAHTGALAVADLDGDGHPDLAMADRDADTADVLVADAIFANGFEARPQPNDAPTSRGW